jgi:hypothetical protein
MMWLGVFGVVYHLENAEMTPELQDDLINFSFDNLQNVFRKFHIHNPDEDYNIYYFSRRFSECLKKLVCHHFCSSVLQIPMHGQLSHSAIL